jgi:hypothetical protein
VTVRAAAVGLNLEEHRDEIAAAWKRAVGAELPSEDPALGFAVAPLLRELALALRGDAPALRPGPDGAARCAVLVRSGTTPARVVREMKLLRRTLWEALRKAGRAVALDERRAADEWLDEALAVSLERLDRVRLRLELYERGPLGIPQATAGAITPGLSPAAGPPPRPARRPPPLPAARRSAVTPPDATDAAEIVE